MTNIPAPNNPADALKAIYRRALVIREAELSLQQLYVDGKVPGFLHLSIGQEAVASSVSEFLNAGDTVSSNHRGHGHTLAKGVDLTAFFAEILGRASGICGGRGGSMHVADLRLGMLGANGIVGAGLPITTGSALALKLRGKAEIAVVYFGDGALAEGLVHECLNIAKLWSLPVLFCCENNGWSEFSPTERQMAVKLKDLAGAYDIAYAEADGNDMLVMHATAQAVIGRMRAETFPHVLECHTTRVRGHFEGDKQDYRAVDEMAQMLTRDPLVIGRARLIELGVDPAWIDATDAQVRAANSACLAQAMAADLPDPSNLLDDVYTSELHHHG